MVAKDNIFLTYLKHPKMWLNALLGKPNAVSIPSEQVTYQDPQNPNPSATTQTATPANSATPLSPSQTNAQTTSSPMDGDSILQDLNVFKGIAQEAAAKVKEVASPVLSKGLESSNQAATVTKAFAKTDKFKKMIPILLFVLVLIIVGIIGFSLIKNMGKKDDPTIVTGPTPTSADYYPTEPSLYADDPEVLKLEEMINQLDREIAGTQLRETTLNSPVLDFNINFNGR
jgi:hypothetical protein